jgi:transposase
VLAYFTWPGTGTGTGNGPTDAINGRLERLRSSALGFRNVTNYIARSLLETRRLETATTPCIVKSAYTAH